MADRGMGLKGWLSGPKKKDAHPGKVERPVALDKLRIAVLPMANISPNAADDYFADGLTEELISTVSRVKGLAVTSRTSIMKYKRVEKAIPEVGQELGVGTVLEGSVRKGGSKVRVAVQLIDVQSDKHLWSQSYDREIEDIFAIQSDIAQNVAAALEMQLLAEERIEIHRKPTENMEAYQTYLKGRFYWNERNPDSVKKAMSYFEDSIAKDSGFAEALVGLADCYLVLTDQAVLAPREALSKARLLINRALKINDRLAEAHASLGNLQMEEWKWSEVEAEYKRAIELNPNYATAHHWYAILLSITDRLDEALDEIRKALDLDPVSPIVNMNFANVLVQVGRFDEGIEQFRQTLNLDPNFGLAHAHLGGTFVSRGQFEEGIYEIRKAQTMLGKQPWALAFLGYAYGVKGDRKSATVVLRELEDSSKNTFIPTALFGVLHFAMGDKEVAYSYFIKAFEERSTALAYIKVLSIFGEVRADPKFSSLLERIGHSS